MRKYIATIALATAVACGAQAPAQGTCQEQCKQYLPKAGDFGFGVDVVPLLKTIGGAISSDETTSVGGSPVTYDGQYLKPNVSVMGKYMLTDNWALKVNLGIAVSSNTDRQYVRDDLASFEAPTDEVKVVDHRKTTRSGGSLQLGAEYRVGQRRVQGVFGAGVLFGFSTDRVSYSYGNAITQLNQNPSSAFGGDSYPGMPSGYRPTSYNSDGPNFIAGVYGSAGIEWFVAPKIALGASVDLTLYGSFGSKGYVKSEGYNQAYELIDERTDLHTPGNRGVHFGTDNIGGSLYMVFYF